MTNNVSVLNRVFHRQCRSLAQYVADSWPWTHRSDAAAEELVRSVMTDERRWAERLSELIDERGGVPLPGTFPGEFTQSNLHYVALDFLIGLLLQSIRHDIQQLEYDLAAAGDDPTVQSLFRQMIERKQGQIEALGKHAPSTTAASA